MENADKPLNLTKEQQKVYDEIQAEIQEELRNQIEQEWASKGKTERDWSKYKVIFFDESKSIQVTTKEKFEEAQQLKLKEIIN